jgi:hypothetical protein
LYVDMNYQNEHFGNRGLYIDIQEELSRGRRKRRTECF